MPMRRRVSCGGRFGGGSFKTSCSRDSERRTTDYKQAGAYDAVGSALGRKVLPAREVGASILSPAVFARLHADGVKLAPTGCKHNAIGRHASRD